jgi:predicted AlkP superfamily pyrophosphatase or phosphodiesterase
VTPAARPGAGDAGGEAVPSKLVLVVIDAMKPAMLERAVSTGRAPALARIMRDGTYVPECVAAYPSVTPVCAATIATGASPREHQIPSMNWFHREEGRYIEYGTSFGASRAFGIRRSLTDTIYNMNGEHLSRDVETVFESLDDADLRTAGTTYLMYRGRHEHEPADETALVRLATQVFRKPVQGPREFFYADIFASRRTGCRAQLGLPGVRDQHAGCVGAHLVEQDLFDFLLLSLPDNDTHSHKFGPFAQVSSIADADRQIERLMHAAGGADAFLADHAVIVCSDHSQSTVEAEIDLFAIFEDFPLLPASAAGRRARDAQIAICPASRSAQVYVLDGDEQPELLPRLRSRAVAAEGVDLVMHRTDHPDGEALVENDRGELRFRSGGDLTDLRGRRWGLDGDPAVLDLETSAGTVSSRTYPDALGRIWDALHCRTSGELLLSAAPGYEFLDWGRAHHVGGGSHGSLHAVDSHAVLLFHGVRAAPEREQWSLQDIVPMILGHFEATSRASPRR